MKIHPLLHLIATEPHLLGEHVSAYSDLVGVEIQKTSKMWMTRAVFWAAAAFFLLVGLLFTGGALMLWAVVPGDSMNMPWLLVLVPLVPLLGGGFCALKARAQTAESAFGTIKEQVNADLAMLREMSATA
jgi:hypothetical protein